MPAVYTIPAEQPFLQALVEGLLRRPVEELASTLVLLPSRRACLLARDAFIEASGETARLLPNLRPVGEPDEDELVLAPDLLAGLPEAISPVHRQLLLTRLVLAVGGATGREMPHEQAVRLAGELASLLDEVATEGVSLARLGELAPAELAEHWQITLAFLKILQTSWPAILSELGLVDPPVRRNMLLDALARRWRAHPPKHPVVVAGTSGSIPAVANLVATVADLRRGSVVLQGLDQELDETSWAGLQPTHPQWMLKRLLTVMDLDRAAVLPWPAEVGGGPRPARTAFLREVVRPAVTAGRGLAGLVLGADSAAGLTLETHPDTASEALTLALRIRAAVATPDRRVALVTPDRTLARRVAVELRRWDIEVDDSAGVPLDQSPPGSFLLLTAHLAVDDGAPLALLSALKHPLASGGTTPGTFRRHVRALERGLLRGPRLAGGLPGLVAALQGWAAADDPEADQASTASLLGNGKPRWPAPVPPAELAAWLAALTDAVTPLRELCRRGEASSADLLASHRRFVEWLAADADGDTSELWAREAGSAARAFWGELELAAAALERVPVSAYPALLAVLMGTVQVRPRRGAHPRVAILGQLESRLAHADLVLLGGLTEGTWPAPIDAGPWLNRRMRHELGLPPVEQAIGIGAADFVAQASAPEVVLSWARKDAVGTPRTASRWVQRLVAVSKAARLDQTILADPCWRDWAQALDQPASPPRPCEQPSPRPPLAARPRELSATDIEKLLRNPYGLYAKRILRLAALDELDADPGGAERGQIIHEALRRFVETYPAALPDDPQRELERIGHELFRAIADQPQVLTIWWPRFRSTAAWFVERERERRANLKHIAAELDGQLVIGEGDSAFKIRARADRIEVGRDGALTILDYKTGRPPESRQVARGLAPQLPIEALIASGGGFTGIAPSEQIDLLYWHLSGGPSGGSERCAGGGRLDGQELLARARVGLRRLIAHFANPASAYVAVPRPEVAPAFDDYEHLSRIAEWRGWSSS